MIIMGAGDSLPRVRIRCPHRFEPKNHFSFISLILIRLQPSSGNRLMNIDSDCAESTGRTLGVMHFSIKDQSRERFETIDYCLRHCATFEVLTVIYRPLDFSWKTILLSNFFVYFFPLFRALLVLCIMCCVVHLFTSNNNKILIKISFYYSLITTKQVIWFGCSTLWVLSVRFSCTSALLWLHGRDGSSSQWWLLLLLRSFHSRRVVEF